MPQTDKDFYTKIQLPFKIKKPVLAFGSHTKNTVCFAEGNFAYISPIHGDLSNLEDYKGFEKEIRNLLKKRPKVIAYDLHPEYQSTRYALNLSACRQAASTSGGYMLCVTQHHHAHITSCMAENGLKDQKVIGVAFDGTGLGVDGSLWGGEFLVCDYRHFKRAAHLRQIPLVGASEAIRQPWRLAVIWLYLLYKDDFLRLKIDFVRGLDRQKWKIVKSMYLADFNSLPSSSAGRIFDAAASLILAKYRANFEAQLACMLEKTAMGYKASGSQGSPSTLRYYKFDIRKNNNTYMVDPLPVFKAMVTELKIKEAKEKIAYRFHMSMAEMILKTCNLLRKREKINKVIFSGGVFQNKLLLNPALDLLYKKGFMVFAHKRLSCSDSGISLGQAMIAGA